MTLAFLGTGSMGSALLAGMIGGGVAAGDVVATTRSRESAAAVRERLGVTALSLEEDETANRTAVTGADFVFVGVEPVHVRDTLAEVAGALEPDAVLVSMAAGVSIEQLAVAAGSSRIIRIMPNTPAAIGHGVVSISAGREVPAQAVRTVSELLAGAGDVVEMPESDIHAMTAVAGSGAAYFYLLADALVTAGVEQGLSSEVATRLVVGTANGAGRMLAQRPESPAELRESVTSTGGTTAAAMAVFESEGFRDAVVRAVGAATARSREIEAGG
ncbi:pyrroline-5-carboxylate reductase [Brevibacterium daeguense]|uniref:Pyrroline-5-carboxylate reductase n=1 Tax=Brevibacterium daeguense TaxID=909936 RepID=A0ABP8EL86_9MICO|nr:pyrroline-5-carboxylate reductase [Brevibacterium daeguense]